MKLLEALAEAKETDLAELDALIQAQERHLDALISAKRLLTTKFHGNPKRGSLKAAREAAKAARKAQRAHLDPELADDDDDDDRPSAILMTRREKLLKLLLHSGPLAVASICSQLDIPSGGSSAKVLDHFWFAKTGDKGPGKPMTISLTDKGRTAAEALANAHRRNGQLTGASG